MYQQRQLAPTQNDVTGSVRATDFLRLKLDFSASLSSFSVFFFLFIQRLSSKKLMYWFCIPIKFNINALFMVTVIPLF